MEFNGDFYFLAGSSSERYLWKSDGSTENTVQLAQVCDGGCSFIPFEIVAANSGIFILIDNQELWFSDGTSDGTNLVKLVGDGSVFGMAEKLTPVGNQVFFGGYDSEAGLELWKSDGTEAGTGMVKDIYPGSRSGFEGTSSSDELLDLTDFAVIGNTVYFTANDGETGPELWRSNGTENSTKLVQDIFTRGSLGSYPQDITAIGNTLFFSAFTLEHGYELWRSQGTASTTRLVKDIEPRQFTIQVERFTCEQVGLIEICRDRIFNELRPFSSLPKGITELNGKAVFRAYTGTHGYETWVSDGTDQGTFLLRDIRSGTNGSTDLAIPPTDGDFQEDIINIRRWKQSVVVNDELFFAVQPDGSRIEIWKTDGTTGGTREVFVLGGGNILAREVTQFEANTNETGDFYFTPRTSDGSLELWQYDASRNRVFEFTDQPTPALTEPEHLRFFNGDLYFIADNGIKGNSLWTIITDTDGDGIGDRFDRDDDGDGIPDAYERQFGFNPLDPSDALIDSDGDGQDNLTEFRQRTDPLVPNAPRPVLITPILDLLLN